MSATRYKKTHVDILICIEMTRERNQGIQKHPVYMLKFQPPMLNDEVCRMATDKQTHKYIHKKTYILSKN